MNLSSEDQAVWRQYRDITKRYLQVNREFLEAKSAILGLNSESRVELIRKALIEDSRIVALETLKLMDSKEVQKVFGELLPYATYETGLTWQAQQIILSLPSEWVVNNIEKYAQPLLDTNDYFEYEGLLRLYELLDKKLALRLANYALQNEDREIVELGQGALIRLTTMRDRSRAFVLTTSYMVFVLLSFRQSVILAALSVVVMSIFAFIRLFRTMNDTPQAVELIKSTLYKNMTRVMLIALPLALFLPVVGAVTEARLILALHQFLYFLALIYFSLVTGKFFAALIFRNPFFKFIDTRN